MYGLKPFIGKMSITIVLILQLANSSILCAQSGPYPPSHCSGGSQDSIDGLPDEAAWLLEIVAPKDPNEIVGPTGYGNERFVAASKPMGYTIYYENDPKMASAPARNVYLFYPFDDKQAMTSFELGEFGFNGEVFNVPPGKTFYTTRLDLRASLDLYVDVTAGIDVTKKRAFWIFESIEPGTGLPPTDPLKGMLPVKDSTLTGLEDTVVAGEGFATFTVKPATSVHTGDTIFATAQIVFDDNDTIPTNIEFNTIDAAAPTSTVIASPANDTIILNITANDDNGGSGVKGYDLFIAKDGSNYIPYFTNITVSVLAFIGESGSQYHFFTLATDNVGNREPMKSAPDVSVAIAPILCNEQHDTLLTGWNMISSYIIPDNPNMKNVFQNIASGILIVKNNAGQSYIPSLDINTIGNWDFRQGYKVKTSEAAILTIGCTEADPHTPIALDAGWSIISYLLSTPMDIGAALSSLAGDIIIVKNYDGQAYIPTFNINSIGNMLPGQGYKLKLSNASTLIYPAAKLSGSSSFRESPSPRHFVGVLNTGSNATVIFPQGVLDESAKPGDELAVFTENSLLVGSAVVENNSFVLTVWGDDQQTQAVVDGMADGEPFHFMYWNRVSEIEQPIKLTFSEGPDHYTVDGISIVELQKATGIQSFSNGSWINCFPNPTTGKLYFEIFTPENSQLSLSIYDVAGKKVIVKEGLELQAGKQTIEMNMSGFAIGQYMYEARTNEDVVRGKVVIER